MNRRSYRIQARFKPSTRFEVVPEPPAPFRETRVTALEELKERLLQEALREAGDPACHAPLRRASHDAAALAWSTAVPLLLFPELFREKASAAVRYAREQAAVGEGDGRREAGGGHWRGELRESHL